MRCAFPTSLASCSASPVPHFRLIREYITTRVAEGHFPSSDQPVHIESIDSTVCVCQSQSGEYHDASSCALFLEVL